MKCKNEILYTSNAQSIFQDTREPQAVRCRRPIPALAAIPRGAQPVDKNEACLRSGNFWSKIYSTRCDRCSGCHRAPNANKFGTLICDFPEFGPYARAMCWLATTPRQGASNAEFQAAVRNRNPIDRFTLIAGKRPNDKGVSSRASSYSTSS